MHRVLTAIGKLVGVIEVIVGSDAQHGLERRRKLRSGDL